MPGRPGLTPAYLTAVGEAERRHGVAILPADRRHDAVGQAIESMLDEDFHDRMLPFNREAAIADVASFGVWALLAREAGLP